MLYEKKEKRKKKYLKKEKSSQIRGQMGEKLKNGLFYAVGHTQISVKKYQYCKKVHYNSLTLGNLGEFSFVTNLLLIFFF